jgi:hypothetical protein
LYVPLDYALRAQVLRIYYDDAHVGHFGYAKTLDLLRRKY